MLSKSRLLEVLVDGLDLKMAAKRKIDRFGLGMLVAAAAGREERSKDRSRSKPGEGREGSERREEGGSSGSSQKAGSRGSRDRGKGSRGSKATGGGGRRVRS